MRFILRWYYKLIGMTPDKMPMVKWWKKAEFIEGKLVRDKSGAQILVMQGEDYPIMSFPRSHILLPVHGNEEAVTLEERVQKYGAFSVLKHEIKNQIFNDNWKRLEEGTSKEEVIQEIKKSLRIVSEYIKPLKYDLMPPEVMCPAVREIHRAWTKAVPSELSYNLRDILTLIMQEDDAYKYRVQWLAWWMPFIKVNPIKILDKCLMTMEHAEVLEDMKERIRLLRRIIMLLLEDKGIKEKFTRFFREVDWKKVKLTKGDAYHMRGKYFKVDYGILEY